MALKDKIYTGDNFPVRYQVRKSDPENPTDTWGLPQTVVSAVARLFDGNTQELVELGGTDVFEVPATVDPPTGLTRADRGSTVSYVLPSAFTQTAGTYILFITATMDSGVVQTENRKFTINELH